MSCLVRWDFPRDFFITHFVFGINTGLHDFLKLNQNWVFREKYVNVVWLSLIVWEIRNDFIGYLLAREGQARDYPFFSTAQAK